MLLVVKLFALRMVWLTGYIRRVTSFYPTKYDSFSYVVQ